MSVFIFHVEYLLFTELISVFMEQPLKENNQPDTKEKTIGSLSPVKQVSCACLANHRSCQLYNMDTSLRLFTSFSYFCMCFAYSLMNEYIRLIYLFFILFRLYGSLCIYTYLFIHKSICLFDRLTTSQEFVQDGCYISHIPAIYIRILQSMVHRLDVGRRVI
jgi:hypothetical protein